MTEPTRQASFAHCPIPFTSQDTVQLGHGSGGKMMQDLIARLFLAAFDNEALNSLDDQAVVQIGRQRLAISTDSFVVDPLFFPGGDIGHLAICGTVNDVAMCGARPLFLSVGFIIEEGFSLADLQTIVLSMKQTADKAGVVIVTGDTKVVNRGKGDKLFINTTGIGVVEHDFVISSRNLSHGDLILLNGTIAEHGIAVLSRREGLAFQTTVTSDAAPLNGLVAEIVRAGGSSIHAMRDATRGGLAAVLNEFAANSNVGIRVREDRIAVRPAVAGACEMLGFDPLYVANEGKVVVVVARESVERVLDAMRSHPLGKDTSIIGEVIAESPGSVTMQTRIGGTRFVDMPVGEQLPRIC